ncbi:MAG: glycosyltransferase family 4 protein [Kiritimatiellia bacterium]
MNAPPAIAMVWDDMTRLGGVNTWLYQCVDGLPRRGLDTWLLDFGAAESGQVDVSRWRRRILTLRPGPWEGAAGFRRRVRRELEARGIRLLVFHEHRFGEDVLDCLPPGFPAVNILHVDRPDPRYLELALALDPLLDEQYCVSPRLLEKFQPLLPPGRRGRVFFLPLGVDIPPASPARPPAAASPLRLVYAGRIAREQKRIQDLPVFARALREAGVPFELEVFGDGPDLESLRTAAADLGDRVRIHGSGPQAEILDALGRAHLLLLFSDYEGLPLVLLEAMARSVVPLVTRIRSGVGDLVADGVNARLFDPGQPAAAAAIALELARDPAAFAAMAAAARTTAEAYDLERCMDAYASHFRPLAARATAGGPARADLRRPAGWKQRLADHLPRRWLEKTP